ncbi:MAG: B-box zinc finger protein [Candidatus Hodarchaeales archaeon]
MSQKKDKKTKIDKKTYCANHPKRKAIDFCEKCDSPFCNSCLSEVSMSNFLSAAFLASRDSFTTNNLCRSCERKQRIRRVGWATFLLFIFVISMLAMAFGNRL